MTEHIVPRRIYYQVYGVLIACTFLTWWIAGFELGAFNAVAALTIAVFKAGLVVLFFMHARYASRLIWLVAVAGVFWLGILLTLTLSDYWTRAWSG
jgi:cytochrome c oxidase subunit IV